MRSFFPTYKDLQEKNKLLLDAVNQFRQNPSNDNFEKACNLWITAREPWEKSEAFLIGPVANLGLDPNMDSWRFGPERYRTGIEFTKLG